MADLQADILNEDFWKNFLPETVYLVPEEAAILVARLPEPADALAVAEAAPAVTPALPERPHEQAAKAFEVLGENRKGVAVLVTLPAQEFEKLPQLEFLQKILYAIGLHPADVAFVNNTSGATARFEALTQALKVNYIISFASRLHTDLPHEKFILYNPVTVGEVPVVFSQALAVLEKDVEHKKLLWNALRQVFLPEL